MKLVTTREMEEPSGCGSGDIAGDTLVAELMGRALAAQRQIEGWREERIDLLLSALAGAVTSRAKDLAIAAVAETGMGNVRDKTLKNSVASMGVYAELAGRVGYGELAFDRERQIAEIASPVGVVVGLVPATHPVATFIFKTLIAIKGRNAIVFSPSRRALAVSEQVGRLLRQTLRAIGAPEDLVQWQGGGNRERTAALMSHPRAGLVLATGGHGMVRAAHSSGKPAIGVGPGNAPVLIDADADLKHAAASVVDSKSFDNGLICGAENHLVVDAAARAGLAEELVRHGAALLTTDESVRVRDAAVHPQNQRLLPSVIGREASVLAERARVRRPYAIRLLVIPAESVAASSYLTGEKLAPIVSLFTVGGMDEGIAVCRALLECDGAGHTAIVHTRNLELTRRFAAAVAASRILVNSPATQGLLGLTTGLVPSMTLGCGTWGGTSTTNSVTYRDLLNIKRVAYYTHRRA